MTLKPLVGQIFCELMAALLSINRALFSYGAIIKGVLLRQQILPGRSAQFFVCLQGNNPCFSVNHHCKAKRTALLIYVFCVTLETFFKVPCEKQWKTKCVYMMKIRGTTCTEATLLITHALRSFMFITPSWNEIAVYTLFLLFLPHGTGLLIQAKDKETRLHSRSTLVKKLGGPLNLNDGVILLHHIISLQ